DFTGLIPESECLFLITQLQGEALSDAGAERSGFQQYLQVAGDRCRQLKIDTGGMRPAAKRRGVGQAINPSEHSWPGRSAEIDDVRRGEPNQAVLSHVQGPIGRNTDIMSIEYQQPVRLRRDIRSIQHLPA